MQPHHWGVFTKRKWRVAQKRMTCHRKQLHNKWWPNLQVTISGGANLACNISCRRQTRDATTTSNTLLCTIRSIKMTAQLLTRASAIAVATCTAATQSIAAATNTSLSTTYSSGRPGCHKRQKGHTARAQPTAVAASTPLIAMFAFATNIIYSYVKFQILLTMHARS